MKGIFIIAQIACIGIILAGSSPLVKNNEGNEELRLIKTSEDEPPKWMTQNEIFELIGMNKGFMDITDFNYPDLKIKRFENNAIPDTLRFNEIVRELITKLDRTRMEQFLLVFSSYHNRYYRSESGKESQEWLLSEVEKSLENYAGSSQVREFRHGYGNGNNGTQSSIIAKLEGTDATLKDEVVVIGAHLDSVTSGPSGTAHLRRSPGADDNGSGSVVILEALRAIAETGLTFKRTVEFHWYAAEEIGLVGSQGIAESYGSNGVNVVGMLNLDVVGFHVSGIDEIAVYVDHADQDLAQFVRVLTDGYLEFGRRNRTCGYGCSDHASWTRNGFPAVFVAEAIDTPLMHSIDDTIITVNFSQLNEFAKLVVGFAVEMGEPTNQAVKK